MSEQRDLDWVLSKLREAARLLTEAEHAGPSAVATEIDGVRRPECDELDNLVHVATHEAATTVCLCLESVARLRVRIALRRAHSMLTDGEFEAVVSEGWSVKLVKQVASHNPGLPMADISARLKALEAAWE